MEEIKAARCVECNKLYDLNASTFISIHSNLCKGMSEDIIGDGSDDTIIICPKCLIKIIKENYKIPATRSGTYG